MKFNERPQAAYLFGAVIVWVGLIAATALVLGGTSYFAEMAPILFVGAFYFLVIAPEGIWHSAGRPRRSQVAAIKRDHVSPARVVARLRERLYLFGLLGLIGLLGIPFNQPLFFLCYLLFGLFAFTPRTSAARHPGPR